MFRMDVEMMYGHGNGTTEVYSYSILICILSDNCATKMRSL